MRRKHKYLRGASPIEQRMGRLMRAPDGHGAPAAPAAPAGPSDSPAPPANTGVNPVSAAPAGDGNTGQEFNYEAFWAQPDDGSNSTDSTNSGQDDGRELGQHLLTQIQNFSPGQVFTAEALQQMASGDLTGVNAGMQSAIQGSMTQMLQMVATLMQRFETHIQSRFDEQVTTRIQGSQTAQRDEAMLAEAFQGFSNPAMRPVITGVFRQSLTHTNGDRKKALELTRGMLKAMGQSGAGDMGLQRQADPDNNLADGPSRLVQELLQMGG